MKRVLLITYYWPPAGGPGVHRWLRMTNYMKECGYDVTVLTPENPHYQQLDEAGLEKVSPTIAILKLPIFEVTRWFEKLSGKKTGTALLSEKKSGFFSNLSLKIRGNYFIPDPKIYWVKPAVRFLSNYFKQEKFDLIITTGPPHSLHLIGLALKNKLGVKWIADFRDPWTNIDFYRELQLNKSADAKHRKLEREVLKNADMVTVIGETMQKEFSENGAKNCIIVTNGFEFSDSNTQIYPENFTLTHYGSIAPARNPEVLWKALSALIKENAELINHIQIRLIGSIDYSVKSSAESYGLAHLICYQSNVSHAESLELQKKDAALLLIANNSPNAKGILTGKFFEYLNTSRPIVAIGPLDGDLAHAIKKTEAGNIFHYNDVDGMKKYLVSLYNQFKTGELKAIDAKKEEYDTRNITNRFCKEVDKIMEAHR